MTIPIFKQGRRAVMLLSGDDTDFRELARDAFSSASARVDVHGVSSGEECLAFLRAGSLHPAAARPDLLLLDHDTPGTDAAEVMRQIRAEPGMRTLPTVVCSTTARDADVTLMHELGCNSFILKPATLGDLRRTLATLARYWFHTCVLPER